MIKPYSQKAALCLALQLEEFPYVYGESGMYFQYKEHIFSSRFPPSKGDWVVWIGDQEPEAISDFQFRKKYEV